MDLHYAVQILISLLIISLFLIVLMSAMICASLYNTRPLWIRLREENEMELAPQPSSQQDWETNCLFGLCPTSSKCQTEKTKLLSNGPKTRMNCGSPKDWTHSPMKHNWRPMLPKCFNLRYTQTWIKWFPLSWKLLRSEIAWLFVRKN